MTWLQDLYPEDVAHCYGCGRLNEHGLHIQTEWAGGEGVARFQPAPHHIAIPGFVYGGLIASLVDCHSIATAAAAWLEAQGGAPGLDSTPRFVTGSLHVDFLKPTPLGPALTLRARPVDVGEKKVVVEVSVSANDTECVRGRVVAVRLPPSMAARA